MTREVVGPVRGRTGPLKAVNHEPTERTYRALGHVTDTLMPLFGRREWHDQDKVPQNGGVIFVSNHISHFDPLVLGHYLIWSGRWPRFLGKVELFTSPWIGWLARGCGQIPVERGSARAVDSLAAAQTALKLGKAVAIYPEGTVTADPDGWPMVGRTGVARLAFDTGAPVVPVAQWGAQRVLPRHGKALRFRRDTLFQVRCGDPVDLDDLVGGDATRQRLEAATTRIMDALTDLLVPLRGEPAPSGRWNPRTKQREPVVRQCPPPASQDGPGKPPR